MERYGWRDEAGRREAEDRRGERTYAPRERGGTGDERGREWRGGPEDWRRGEDWRAREGWLGGERDEGRERWSGDDSRSREGERGRDWRPDDWRAGEHRPERPEIDPPWVEPGPRWRRSHRDTRGMLEWEDRGPLEWLGDRFREATGRRGRGPKGYRRSDERIHDDVCERIARAGLDADDVEVSVKDRVVTLSGTVRSRPEKWRLEELADDVYGVEHVEDQLRVRRDEHGAGTPDPRH